MIAQQLWVEFDVENDIEKTLGTFKDVMTAKRGKSSKLQSFDFIKITFCFNHVQSRSLRRRHTPPDLYLRGRNLLIDLSIN